RPDAGPGVRAHAADAIATTILYALVQGPPEPGRLAAEAEGYCRQAMGQEGKLSAAARASVRGTVGCALAGRGEAEQAEAELRRALAVLEEPRDRAWCLAYLAVLAARAGRRPEAERFLGQARALAPEHPALGRAARELGG